MYSTGYYSDRDIAEWMNNQPAIETERTGQKPVGKEMVRDLLKNRVYTGQVPYAETFYKGSLGEGKRSNRNRKQWFEGKHEPIISEELCEYCQHLPVHVADQMYARLLDSLRFHDSFGESSPWHYLDRT